MMGGYDPTRHLVAGIDDLLKRLSGLHENAVVAWDRDAPSSVLGDRMVVAASVGVVVVDGLVILGYAVDGTGKIFRLVRDVTDLLGVRWVVFDRQGKTR